MAEIIVRPKKFTHEWFLYIWDYYKYHIIAVVTAVVLIASAIVQSITSVKYDTNINIVISGVLDSEKTEMLAVECAKNSDDLNGNNRVDISTTQLNFTQSNMENGEMHSAMINKLVALFSSYDEVVYIVDSYTLDRIKQMQGTETLFYPSNEWSDENTVKKGDFAVSLANSTVLKQLEIDSTDLYVMLARHGSDDELKPEEENGIKIAEFLLK